LNSRQPHIGDYVVGANEAMRARSTHPIRTEPDARLGYRSEVAMFDGTTVSEQRLLGEGGRHEQGFHPRRRSG
jgi:hypothetical protein